MHLRSLRAPLAALALLFTAACLEPAAESTEAAEAALTSSLDDEAATDGKVSISSISLCGLSCPGGFHPISYGRNLSCGTGGFGDNSVTCDPNTGDAFGSCGLSCPSGYHPTSYGRNLSCGTGGFGDNSVSCGINAGASFGSCGLSCPAGYVATSFGRNLSCGTGGFGDNSVTCTRLLQGNLSAFPSSIALAPGQTGSTTVSWSTQAAQSVEVRAQPPGQGERTIGTALSGSVAYGPIGAGETHALRLYGNGVLLSSTQVSAYAQTGTISASPQTVIITGAVGSTTIQWSTQGVGNGARVYVSVDGGAGTVFAGGASGSQVASWIQPGHSYRFSLRIGAASSAELAAVTVVGQGQAPAIDPIAGSWWNPARSGNGFDLRITGNTLIFYWLTYDGGGTPVWYLGSLAREPGRWRGDVYYYTWNGAGAAGTPVGTATITLTSAERGQLAWSLNGRSGSEPIERLVFGGGGWSPSLSGLWYLPTESGWGVNFETQGNTHVTYLLAYGAGGAPTWVYGATSGSGPTLSFGLVRTTGNNLCPGCTGPTSVTAADAGTMSVALDQVGNGRARTTIDAFLAGGSWRRVAIDLVRLL